MSFLSPTFFLFFPVVAAVYFLLPRQARNLWLLVSSWFFYLCAGAAYFAFLLCATLLTYWGARQLARRPGKPLLGALLVLLFGALFLFKYLGFAFSLAEQLLTRAGLAFSAPELHLILPVGISFYLFAAAGYLIDVYRGKVPAEKNFLLCALFLSFFPHLLSGPIARAGQFLPQLRESHPFSAVRMRSGLLRFLWGAFKKLMLADRLSLLVSTVYAAPGSFGALQLLTAAVAFSVQIYCDFSAYSDMALGAAEVMGFHLMENFRTPYFSRSIGEFWRRWHISLSFWFRDYLYIPLGGNRRGTARKYGNVLIVFAVSGLWHGAALTFVTWGLLNGLYQVAGGITAPLRARVRKAFRLDDHRSFTALWQIFVTFCLSTVAWVFFKAASFGQALAILRGMVSGPLLVAPALASMGWDRAELAVAFFSFLLLLAVDIRSLSGPVRARLCARPMWVWALSTLFLLLAVVIFGVYGTGYNPQDFIYFKF